MCRRAIKIAELRHAIRKMSSGKACKQGDIPIECYKEMADFPSQALFELFAANNVVYLGFEVNGFAIIKSLPIAFTCLQSNSSK